MLDVVFEAVKRLCNLRHPTKKLTSRKSNLVVEIGVKKGS